MNKELIEILLALRTNAIRKVDCIAVYYDWKLDGCCDTVDCFNCPLFQLTYSNHYSARILNTSSQLRTAHESSTDIHSTSPKKTSTTR